MRKTLILSLVLALVVPGADAQDRPNVEIQFLFPKSELSKDKVPREKVAGAKVSSTEVARDKVANSLYGQIDFLDSRRVATIGPVRVGLFGNASHLSLKAPVQPQLAHIVEALMDSTAGGGELLFQLRSFNYIEEFSTRFCHLRATLYSKSAGQYRKLLTLDTVIVIRLSDIGGEVQKGSSLAICDFIRDGLLELPSDSTTYSLNDLGRMDSVETSRLALYTRDSLVDGLYKAYASFADQRPDLQCSFKVDKNGDIKAVWIPDENGKEKKVDRRGIYAVVYQGRAFIATEYGFYRLTKAEGDLLFTGDVRVPASRGDLAGGQFALGLTGRLLASQGYKTTYTMAIDHLNGDFLHLRLIPQPETSVQ
jgi:hypothetical protein